MQGDPLAKEWTEKRQRQQGPRERLHYDLQAKEQEKRTQCPRGLLPHHRSIPPATKLTTTQTPAPGAPEVTAAYVVTVKGRPQKVPAVQ